MPHRMRLQSRPMNNELTIAFIGGGNMAWALACGLADQVCPAANVHIVDINPASHARWTARGMTVSATPDARLSQAAIWVYAVKPQNMKEVAEQTKSFLKDDTLVVSIAAGIKGATLARWIGSEAKPWNNLVRCMPNTPALVSAGASGLAALSGVSEAGRQAVQAVFAAVGEVVWVDDDAALDTVTALSGSGPAYVFLFIESLVAGAEALGLTPEQAKKLALATLAGATKLAAQSDESPAQLRQNVTSKGGTTAAALDVFSAEDFAGTVARAMKAAHARSESLARENE